jgi:hypothetical protein
LYSVGRIWKRAAFTGAAFLTLLIVLNLKDWSGAFDSSFVVYGQTAGGAGQLGPGGVLFGSQSSGTRIIPQIAVGSFDGGLTNYATIVQVTNTGTTAAMLTGTFYKEEANGAPSTTFPFGFTGNTAALADPVPSFSNVLVQPNATVVLTSASSGPGATGWGKITSTGSISVSTVFEFRDVATGTLHSRIGVVSGSAEMSKFTIARMRNVASVFDVGFALVNTGTTDAVITATLYDVNGVQVGSPENIVVAANGHVAKFVQQLFNLSGEPAGTSYSHVVLSSGSPQWASMALAYEGGSINSFAVEQLQ